MTTEERLERIERLLIISVKEALTVAEVAIFLGISESRVRHLTSNKEMPYYKQGSKTYFKKSEIEKWMLNERISTKEDIEAQAQTYLVNKERRIQWKQK